MQNDCGVVYTLFMIKAIIFDLGGVVIYPEVEKIKNYIANYIGIDYGAFHDFFGKYNSDLIKGKISLSEVYSEVVKHFQLKKFSAQDMVKEHLKIFQRIIENLDEDVLNLVERLKKNYIVVCLVNAELDVVPLVRKRGIYDYFQHAYISAEMAMEKPDPEIYKAVLNDLGYKPQETVFVDDKESNVIAARRLGIHGILYKNNTELIVELKRLSLSF